jgi:hypothetical protein
VTFIHSKAAAVLVNEFDLTTYFNEASVEGERAMHDTTCFGANSPTAQPGLRSALARLSGLYDQAALVGSDTVLAPLVGASVVPIVSVAPQGFSAVGNRVYLLQAHEDKYSIGVKVGDMVVNSASFKANDGFDAGVVLHNLTADGGSAGNSTSVDNAAATANGGVAFLHYTAFTGGGANLTIKVQHSTNNSTWADLVTFGVVATGIFSAQRSVVAAATTVNRYLRASWSPDIGASTFTFALCFARR